jgi:thiamine kinase-like enzyme
LIASDTHPGNWLLRNKDAILVDWEKGQYGSPAVDLAHASIYTSTTWDLVAAGAPTLDDVVRFYRDWLEKVTRDLARASRPWLLPMRRLVWLRAITWCIKWRVASRESLKKNKGTARSAEDWSAENSDPALIDHVRDRVDHYLAPETMARVRQEWAPGSPLHDL